jgi:hypothetical protein
MSVSPEITVPRRLSMSHKQCVFGTLEMELSGLVQSVDCGCLSQGVFGTARNLRPDGYRLIENRRDYLSFNFSKRVISASSACITFSELRWSLLKEGMG